MRCYAAILTMGLFELFGASAAKAAPAPGPAEKYFDPQPAALVRAALTEDAARVRELVAAGVNPNSQGPRSVDKNTPQITLLGYAVSQRSKAALRLLIQAGADPLFKPREGDGNVFVFTIVRKDSEMLDALYRAWPIAKVPSETQAENAFSAMGFNCNDCLKVMFKHGLPVGVQDSRGYSLYMEAISREDLETAEWLLKDVGVPVEADPRRDVTPANQLQLHISRYRPGTPTYETLMRLQAIMQSRGIVFPVETVTQRRASLGLK